MSPLNKNYCSHLRLGLLIIVACYTVTVLAQTDGNETTLATKTTTTPSTSATTTTESRTYYDKYLTFPPEYVALLALGLIFLILFVIIIVIICVTAKHRKEY